MCIKKLFSKSNANNGTIGTNNCNVTANKGYDFIINQPVAVKKSIESIHGSLDVFYGKIYYLNMKDYQYRNDPDNLSRVQDYIYQEKTNLEDAGVDFMKVLEIFSAISSDYSEKLLDSILEQMFGQNWKSIQKMLEQQYGL